MNTLFPICLVLFLTLTCNSIARKYGYLSIEIVESHLVMEKNKPIIDLSVSCSNGDTVNLLLYGIASNLIFETSDEFRCDLTRVGAGLCLLVFNDRNERMHESYDFHPDGKYRDLPADVFIDEMSRNKEKFLRETKVIHSGQELQVKKTIDLKNFHLRSGNYEVQIIYYSGEGIYDNFVVGEGRVKMDEISFRARAFQGCVFSNRIPLKVQ